MSKQHLQIAKMLENLVQLQKAKDRELQDNLLGAMAQMLAKSVTEKVPHIIQHELKHAVLPSLHQMVEAYRLQIDSQYSQVKDNFAKVLSSKPLIDAISVSIVNLIVPSLEKSYKDVIVQSLVPSCERVCGQMFQQINETFSKGTKECE